MQLSNVVRVAANAPEHLRTFLRNHILFALVLRLEFVHTSYLSEILLYWWYKNYNVEGNCSARQKRTFVKICEHMRVRVPKIGINTFPLTIFRANFRPYGGEPLRFIVKFSRWHSEIQMFGTIENIFGKCSN